MSLCVVKLYLCMAVVSAWTMFRGSAQPIAVSCAKPATWPPSINPRIKVPGEARIASQSRYKRAVSSVNEKVTLERRHQFEFMSREEREERRLRALDKISTCDGKSGVCFVPGIQVSLLYLEGLSFCKNCVDAHQSGSFIPTWDSHFGPMHYHISGPLVYAVPNKVNGPVLNSGQTKGCITLVDRGDTSLVQKVLRSQKAGAAAVVIVDDGTCSPGFSCGIQGNKKELPGKGYSWRDRREAWDDVFIPSVLVSEENGSRLKSLLDLETMDIPGHGKQQILRDDYHGTQQVDDKDIPR